MQPDWSAIIGGLSFGVVIVGGLLALLRYLISELRTISERLLKIETRLEMDDKGADERRAARRREMREVAKSVFEVEFNGTNPRMQIPPREVG
jgi:hypothetical protein